MNVHALRQLKIVLQRVRDAEKPFDMEYWVKATASIPETEISCSTASCALGWFCRSPEGQKLGFHLRIKNYNWPHYPVYNTEDMSKISLDETYTEGFGLTTKEAGFLFMPSTYTNNEFEFSNIKPQDVIDRIDWLLEGNDWRDHPTISSDES